VDSVCGSQIYLTQSADVGPCVVQLYGSDDDYEDGSDDEDGMYDEMEGDMHFLEAAPAVLRYGML
jgi:hypothetical protein